MPIPFAPLRDPLQGSSQPNSRGLQLDHPFPIFADSRPVKGKTQEIKGAWSFHCRLVPSIATPVRMLERQQPCLFGMKRQPEPAKSLWQDSHHPPRIPFIHEAHYKVSSPGESHPQALSEPDVNLSAHPAPIIQPQAKSPFASGQKAADRVARPCPASIQPSYDGDSASCISSEPTE